MATPIGHSLAGIAIGTAFVVPGQRHRRALIVVALFLANVPDLDRGPGILVGKPALYHQGIVHSLGFAFVASLVLGAFSTLARVSSSKFSFLLAFLAYTSHLVLDLFGPDSRPPYRIPIFWPFCGLYFRSSIPLLLGVHHVASTNASVAEWVSGVFDWYNLRAVSRELLLIIPLIILGEWYNRSKRYIEPASPGLD